MRREFEDLSYAVIGCALEVHGGLGPGLLESVYHECLVCELRLEEIPLRTQVCVPIVYKGVQTRRGLRMDLVVDDSLIVELKSVDRLMSLHEAQLLTYMKLSGIRTGLLFNFNVKHLRDGIKRVVV